MPTAKDIILKPIPAKDAIALIKRVHYSGKVVQNSNIHIGVFLNGKLEGAMQFGSSLDKRKIQGLVSGTGWNEFIELNRMAFTDVLPRNSESRAIGIAMKILRQHAPHLKWVISFADACQCGDGTIYRASGFVLTGIKPNTQVWRHESGLTISRTAMTNLGTNGALKQRRDLSAKFGVDLTNLSAASMKDYAAIGFRVTPGFQLRYIYFLDPSTRSRLTVAEIPFERIKSMGASMYKGNASANRTTPIDLTGADGASPIQTL